MWIIFREDTLRFALGIQNVFFVEVSNRNHAHNVFFYPSALPQAQKTCRVQFLQF